MTCGFMYKLKSEEWAIYMKESWQTMLFFIPTTCMILIAQSISRTYAEIQN